MALETIFPYDEIYAGKADSLKLEVYQDGAAVECTVASYALYNSGRTEIASGSITPSGTPANTLTIPVASDAYENVEENNSVEWTFTVDLEVRNFNNFFDVVKWKIHANVIDSDLEKYYPDIQDHLWTGQANYSTQIQLAWQDVKRDIKAKGRRPSLIVVDADIKKLIELKSFVHIFNAWFRSATDDVWLLRAQNAEVTYQEQFNKIELRYDESQDGIVDIKQRMGMYSLRR